MLKCRLRSFCLIIVLVSWAGLMHAETVHSHGCILGMAKCYYAFQIYLYHLNDGSPVSGSFQIEVEDFMSKKVMTFIDGTNQNVFSGLMTCKPRTVTVYNSAGTSVIGSGVIASNLCHNHVPAIPGISFAVI